MYKKTIVFCSIATVIVITIFVCLIQLTNIVLKNNIAVIVRSIGERTEKKSLERLKNIFGSENVYLIKDVYPLVDASKETFELGLKTKKKWILVADSDIFLFEDKIWIFIKKAEKLIKKDKNAFCFQGEVFDKFSQNPRMSGFYLYYSKNLKYKDEYYSLCKNKIRPEACIRDNIEKAGYNSYQSDDIVGIHDFFQYPKDIIKKCILHSKKNDIEIVEWSKNWQELLSADVDFKYALLGLKIFNSLKDKNFIPDSKEFDKYIQSCDISNSQDELKDEEINEALKKYNTQSTKESKRVLFKKKIKPLVQSY